MTSINDIQARVSQFGVVPKSRFVVEFNSPSSLITLIGPLGKERLAVQCETASLPGKSFSTKELPIYGPVRKLPYIATFTNTIELTFRVGTDFKERSLFDEWQALIMNPSTNMFNYYDGYVSNLIVHQLNQADERIYSVLLTEAWPQTIQAIELSAEARNTYLKQAIIFVYHRWKDVTTEVAPLVIGSNTTTKKAEGGIISTLLQRGAGAFFDQLPRITGSGGTLFGSTLNKTFS